MELAAERPDDLGQAPLDRHVDVLVGLLEGEVAGGELALDLVEPGEHPLELLRAQDPGPEQGAGVRARAAHVVQGQAAVEAQGGVELPEDGIGFLLEARHGVAVYEQAMRVLVTGATGKIGNAVARQLAERGDEVVALVRDPARARELLPESVELAEGDVTDPESLARAAIGAEAAINSMGIFEQWTRDPDVFNRVNAAGARAVARAAREAGARRFVHTSTFDVFDAPRGGTVSEERVADYDKSTAYERSKQLAERLVAAEGEAGIEVVFVNPAAIIGPGPWVQTGWDGVLRDVLRGRLPIAPPGGVTMTWVGDAAEAHLAALDRGRPGERYIVADGFATFPEICEVAIAEAGRGRAPRVLPEGFARFLARAGERVAGVIGKPPLLPSGQLEFLLWEARADSSKITAELGVEPLEWQEAVRRTTRWIVERGL